MIKILQILSIGRKVTTKELRRRFDETVSLRTLQRDMLALSDSGVPLVNEKLTANENTWYLMDHFKQFIPVPLEMNEYLAMEMLKTNLSILKNTSIESDVENLTKKIEQILPDELFLQATTGKFSNLLTNYSMGQYDYSGKNDIINKLIEAITKRRKCLVTYDSASTQKENKFYIEPEKLLSYHSGLYLIFYVRTQNEFWLLAIHRILDLEVFDDVFPNDHPFDEEEFVKNRFGLFSGRPEIIKLKFDKSIRHYIEHNQWHATQKLSNDKKGNLILEMETAATPELISWILGWNKNVQVMKPKGLVEEIRKNLVETLAKY
jgi:predicted DNA-binding transcriptional regulator YafY